MCEQRLLVKSSVALVCTVVLLHQGKDMGLLSTEYLSTANYASELSTTQGKRVPESTLEREKTRKTRLFTIIEFVALDPQQSVLALHELYFKAVCYSSCGRRDSLCNRCSLLLLLHLPERTGVKQQQEDRYHNTTKNRLSKPRYHRQGYMEIV